MILECFRHGRGPHKTSWIALRSLRKKSSRPKETPEAPKSDPRRLDRKNVEKNGSLGCVGVPGRLILAPQINKNPLKIDAKMHSNSGSLFVSILDRFLFQNRREFLFKTVNFSSRFFDIDFALLGKRLSVFCVSIVILRRSHFSRRTLSFLERICFRAFARRQVK